MPKLPIIIFILIFLPIIIWSAYEIPIWISNSTVATSTLPFSIPSANFAIDSFGNVGIGTMVPSNPFTVVTENDNSGLKFRRNSTDNGATAGIGFRVSTTAGSNNYAEINATRISGANTALIFKTYSQTTGELGERIRILPDGNVGIGTTNPTSVLHVEGNTYVTGNVSALSFTDRTPWFNGDALSEINKISGSDKNIEHLSLPEFVRRNIELKELIKPAVEDCNTTLTNKAGDLECKILEPAVYETKIESGRDLGAMITLQTIAIQQLLKRVEALETAAAMVK